MKHFLFLLILTLSVPLPSQAGIVVRKAAVDMIDKGEFLPDIYAEIIKCIPDGNFETRWPAIEKRIAGFTPGELTEARMSVIEKAASDEITGDAIMAMKELSRPKTTEDERLARKILTADPDNAMAHFVLATVYMRKAKAISTADWHRNWEETNLKEKKLLREAHGHALRIVDERPEGLLLAAETSRSMHHAMPFLEKACRFGNTDACKAAEKIRPSFMNECERGMQLDPCADKTYVACLEKSGDDFASYEIPWANLSIARIYGGLCPGSEHRETFEGYLKMAAEDAGSDVYCQIRVQEAKIAFREGRHAEAAKEFVNADKCGRRDPESFYYLALASLEGKGMEKDEALGMRYLEQAAAHDVPAADLLLAKRLLAGEPRNFARGLELMRRAAAMQSPEAKRFLKRLKGEKE